MNVKRKGTIGEHEVERILLDRGIRAYRNDQIYKGGKENPDVYAEINGKPIHVECKRVEKLNIHEAMNQAVTDANGKALPVVAHRKNRTPWLVTLRLTDVLDILEGAIEHE